MSEEMKNEMELENAEAVETAAEPGRNHGRLCG